MKVSDDLLCNGVGGNV